MNNEEEIAQLKREFQMLSDQFELLAETFRWLLDNNPNMNIPSERHLPLILEKIEKGKQMKEEEKIANRKKAFDQQDPPELIIE